MNRFWDSYPEPFALWRGVGDGYWNSNHFSFTEGHQVNSVAEWWEELNVLRSKQDEWEGELVSGVREVHNGSNLSANHRDAIDDSSTETEDLEEQVVSTAVSDFAHTVDHDILRCDDTEKDGAVEHVLDVVLDLIDIGSEV